MSVYIACPAYTGLSIETSKILLLSGKSKYNVIIQQQDFSVLCYNFNTMWFDMLNRRRQGEQISHFVMVHSDIKLVESCRNWLDAFVDEIALESVCADVLSVVVPLKDKRGLTSTGVFNVEKEIVVKRLTMRELVKLPVTFELQDVQGLFPELNTEVHKLVVNTGLMVVKIPEGKDDCWCEHVFFHMKDYVLKVTDKETGLVQFSPQFISEDWMFSADVQRLGRVVKGTRVLQIEHVGKFGYPNYEVWGTLYKDDLS